MSSAQPMTAEGLRSTLSALREARAVVARRRNDAMRQMSEAEADVHQLGRVLTATEVVIDAWAEELAAAEEAERRESSVPAAPEIGFIPEKPCDVE